jgi:hypothetical protein
MILSHKGISIFTILFKAIYELACGEEDLVKDLLMIQKNYADPLVQLHILTSTEVSQRRVSPLGKRRRAVAEQSTSIVWATHINENSIGRKSFIQ